jgi:hypothetical protein
MGLSMVTVHFLGRVIPAVYNVSVGFDPRMDHKEPALNFEATFIVHVKNSNVDVECELPAFDPQQFALLYIRAFDRARTAVDLVAFATGISVTTVFETFVLPNGQHGPIAMQHPDLGKLCTAYRVNACESDKSFDEMYRLVALNHEIFMTLRDLIDANTLPHVGVINCGRVLDSIRRMISPSETNQIRGWAAMQTALNISRDYQEWVSKLSAQPRHGDRGYIAPPDTESALKRTWAIMNRFLEYRRRGGGPLQPPDFPILGP